MGTEESQNCIIPVLQFCFFTLDSGLPSSPFLFLSFFFLLFTALSFILSIWSVDRAGCAKQRLAGRLRVGALSY